MTRRDYSAAIDYEDADPPAEFRKKLPDDLKNAKIKGGETYPLRTTVRLNGPPGVGKTTQVCVRVGPLLDQKVVEPQDVTIVTYRRSLADGVRERLVDWDVIEEDANTDMWTTIHAAANRVTGLLSGDYDENLGQGFGPAVTDYERGYFCREELNVPYYPSSPWDSTRGQLLHDTIVYARNNLLDPTCEEHLPKIPHYEDLMKEWPGCDVPSLVERWEGFKTANELIEFWELLEAALEGPLPPTEVVVVDEYHDVTPLMACVAERWIDAAETAIIAGDPLQVVNAYTGADPRFFTERLDDIPEILLDRTWRLGDEHWQAATQMLQKEFTPPPVKREGRADISEYKSPTFEHSSGRGEWRVPQANTPASPGYLVDKNIDIANGKGSIMSLTRTRKQIEGVSRALDEAGIPHEAQEDLGGWSEHELHLLNALIKLTDAPAGYGDTRNAGLLQKYNEAAMQPLSCKETAALLTHTPARTLSVTADERDTIIDRAPAPDSPDTWTIDSLDEIAKPPFWQSFTAGPASVSELSKAGFDDRQMTRLRKAAVRFDTPLTVEGSQSILNRVRALTGHASKGSEADHVVVYDGITSTIAQNMDVNRSTARNEARTWYVMLSRASEHLHIVRRAFPWMIPHLPNNIAEQAGTAAAENAGDKR